MITQKDFQLMLMMLARWFQYATLLWIEGPADGVATTTKDFQLMLMMLPVVSFNPLTGRRATLLRVGRPRDRVMNPQRDIQLMLMMLVLRLAEHVP